MTHAKPELLRAARAALAPPAPILDNAAVIHDGVRVLDCGDYNHLQRTFTGPVRDLGDVLLTPGLINAHVHLELSSMRGRTVRGQGFLPWVISLVSDPNRGFQAEDVRSALREMASSGTCFCADISTYNAPAVADLLEEEEMGYVSFNEVLGHEGDFGARVPGPEALAETGLKRGRPSLAGHALYSTGAQALQEAKRVCNSLGLPFSIHLAEHSDEMLILADGSGPFADLLRKRGLMERFEPPGCTPVAHADALGLLDEKTLCVHCVHLEDEDIEVLAKRGAFVCLCPRSNREIGVGRAPWEKMDRAGVPLCLGTDSLASNRDLNLWNEVIEVARESREPISLERLLAFATANPAAVLGADGLGALTPGKAACFAVAPEQLTTSARG